MISCFMVAVSDSTFEELHGEMFQELENTVKIRDELVCEEQGSHGAQASQQNRQELRVLCC